LRIRTTQTKGTQMLKTDEIEKDLELDLYKLDEAWLDLPLLSLKWSAELVEAEMAARQLRNELDQLKATLDARMRENPGEYGIQKITEATILAATMIHPAAMDLLKQHHAADIYNKTCKGICLAIETKRKALEGLTQLYSTGYFASKPILSNPGHDMVQEKETAKLQTKSNKTRLRKKL
jgi:hypothetical protein